MICPKCNNKELFKKETTMQTYVDGNQESRTSIKRKQGKYKHLNIGDLSSYKKIAVFCAVCGAEVKIEKYRNDGKRWLLV